MKLKQFNFKKVKSTNQTAIRIIRKTKNEFGLIVSQSQSSGKGQYGRKWISYKGNIFLSFFYKLKKLLPKYITTFPVDKREITTAILANKNNLKKIVNIVHLEIRKKLNVFLNKNKTKKIVILDIPLLLENKINKKNDILIFVQSKRSDVLKRLKKRLSYNAKIIKTFRKIQLPLDYKKKNSQFIFKNNFADKSVTKQIKHI